MLSRFKLSSRSFRIVVIVAVVVAAILMLYFSKILIYRYSPEMSNITFYTTTVYEESVDLSYISKNVFIYYIEYIPNSLYMLFEKIGLSNALKELNLEKDILDQAIILVHTSKIVEKPHEYTSIFSRILTNCSKCVIAYVNIEPKLEQSKVTDSYSILLEVLKINNIYPVFPIDPSYQVDVNKTSKPQIKLLHPVLKYADMVVFSFNPLGVIIVENINSYDFHNVLSAVIEWSELTDLSNIYWETRITRYSRITEPYKMKIIGYIGWITGKVHQLNSSFVSGRQYVYTRYYHGRFFDLHGRQYDVFYIYTQHSGIGYRFSICQQRQDLLKECCNYSFYPKLFITTINWYTDIWPGQVIDRWGPTSLGVGRVVNYTMFSLDLDMKVSVSYSVGNDSHSSIRYRWEDLSEPGYGLVRIRHWVEKGELSDEQLSNILFTVSPSSFGFLDPAKNGGFEPMIVYLSFYMELNIGDNVTTSMYVYLYPLETS